MAYVLEPGTSGNNVSTPHDAAYEPAGDFTVVMYVAPDAWVPGTETALASEYDSATDGAWICTLLTSGFLRVTAATGGAAFNSSCTIAPPGVVDGVGQWLQFSRQSSDGSCDFKYNQVDDETADPQTITWTNIQVNRAGTLGVLDSPATADVHIGGRSTGANPFAGKMYRTVFYDGITPATGTKLWDMNPAEWVSGASWVSSTGETWTLNGTASIVGGGAPASTSHPTLKVEIAFGSTPLDTTPTYTNVTAFVRNTAEFPVTIRRGRQRELDNFDPGSCTLTLSNRTRRFDASYAAGPHFGQLLPRTPMRVTATWATVDYVMFTGWVTGFPQTFGVGGKDATVTIESVDALAWMGTTQLPIDLVYVYADSTVGSLALFLRQGSTGQWSDATSNGYFATVATGVGRTVFEATPVVIVRTGDHKTHKQQGRRGRSKG